MIQLDHPELYEVLEARSGAGQPDHDPSNPVAAWDCDPSRSYQVAFYHESHWYAYGRTNGYATPQGGIAYPGRDLYMEGGANSFAVRYYNVGGTQTLSRWYNRRPTPDEVGMWFGTVPLHEGMSTTTTSAV
jgi:hypothetical protein